MIPGRGSLAKAKIEHPANYAPMVGRFKAIHPSSIFADPNACLTSLGQRPRQFVLGVHR